MRLKIFVMFCSCVLTAGSVLQTTRSSTSGSILAPPLKFAAKMSPDQNQARLVNAYAALPLAFEINDGHTDDQVKALARGRGHTMFLTRVGETVFVLQKLRGLQRDVVRMNLVGGNPTPRVEGLDELPGKANYFIGNDPKKWRTNVPTYARVKVRDVYPGVDVVDYGNQQQLEHDFMVAPGADPDSIRIG